MGEQEKEKEKGRECKLEVTKTGVNSVFFVPLTSLLDDTSFTRLTLAHGNQRAHHHVPTYLLGDLSRARYLPGRAHRIRLSGTTVLVPRALGTRVHERHALAGDLAAPLVVCGRAELLAPPRARGRDNHEAAALVPGGRGALILPTCNFF